MVFFVPVNAEESSANIVFLINTSDEMNFADPNRVAVNAVSQFVRSAGVGDIGVVSFARQIPLRRLENEYVIAGLSAAVLGIEYAGGEYFDSTFSAAANMAAGNALIIHITHENGMTNTSTAAGIPVHAVFVNTDSNAGELSRRFQAIVNAHKTNFVAPEPTPEPTPAPVFEPPPVVHEPTPLPEPAPVVEPTPPPSDPPEIQPEEPVIHIEELEEIIEEIVIEILEGIFEEIPEEVIEEAPEIINEEEFSTEGDVEDEEPPEETEEEPTYTLLFSMAFISLIAAAFSVFRLIKAVI